MVRRAALFSILTAMLFIGSPLFVEEPISAEKFEKYFSHINEILGFVLDTRKMVVSYPIDKKEDLISLLTKNKWTTRSKYNVRTLASILGKLRNLGQILPFGVHLSINLQLSLSAYLIRGLSQCVTTRKVSMRAKMRDIWNPNRTLFLSRMAIRDLQFLTTLLTHAPESIWCRPVSLLIPRDHHFGSRSDACNIALGGFSTPLNFQWRSLALAFSILEKHINIKEFVALFANTYLMMISFINLKQTSRLPSHLANLDGYIFQLLCDNTSAISWMTHASRSHDDPCISRLAHALSLLIYMFNEISPSNFIPKHIPGEQNGEADALSRPQIYPTYGHVFQAYPHLKALTPLKLPSKFTSLIRELIWQNSTKEPIEKTMTALLRVGVNSLKFMPKNWESATLLSSHLPPPTEKA
jgi:hypothetical protein